MGQTGRPRTVVTAEMFGELVTDLRKELAEAGPELRARLLAQPRRATPRSFGGRWWVRRNASLAEAAELTGLSPRSLRSYYYQGKRAEAEGTGHLVRTIPPGDPATGWQAGALALWRAGRNDTQATRSQRWGDKAGQIQKHLPAVRVLLESHAAGSVTPAAVARALGVSPQFAAQLLAELGALPPRLTDDDLAAVLRPVVDQAERRLMVTEAEVVLDEAGMHADRRRVRRALLATGGRGLLTRNPGSADLLPLESLRRDGQVTPSQVAEAFGVSRSAVWSAISAGRLRSTVDARGRRLLDPARIRARADGRLGPVDMDHPKASPDPLPVPGRTG